MRVDGAIRYDERALLLIWRYASGYALLLPHTYARARELARYYAIAVIHRTRTAYARRIVGTRMANNNSQPCAPLKAPHYALLRLPSYSR